LFTGKTLRASSFSETKETVQKKNQTQKKKKSKTSLQKWQKNWHRKSVTYSFTTVLFFSFPSFQFHSIPFLFNQTNSFFFNLGQKVFEWDQTLDEVNIYINLPPNVHSKLFYCTIQSKHIELGIKGNPPFLNVTLISFLL